MSRSLIKTILPAIIIAAVIGVIFLPGYSELCKLREQNEEYQKRIKVLEEQNDELRSELEKMKKDPNYVEKKAREKLGIIKKGEIIYNGKK